MGFGGASSKPSTASIFLALAQKAEDAKLAEKEELKQQQERERQRLAGRGRAANIFAGDTDDSLGNNKATLGTVG